MSAIKILWGQITVVILIALLTIWAAKQWTAWQLRFQAQVGQPWFILARGSRSICRQPSS
jgi:type IV secretion system protein VirD4